MELISSGFLASLLAIVMIDLVLAGDNAIVIALAARNLPPRLRTRAVVWGTVGAIGVRTAMTLLVVWLLRIPGLMVLGGVLLIAIAYKLLAEHDSGEHEVSAASSFWGAMKTIVIADAVMGLDNVLAVAGAAHGSFLLVILGLLISVPIMIGGSQLILRFVERYPIIIYLGGAILAWTSASMIVHEPMLKGFTASNPWFSLLLHAAIIVGVLSAGYLASVREARLAVAQHSVAAGQVSQPSSLHMRGTSIPHKVLIPVDGSTNALQAVRYAARCEAGQGNVEIHLLHVCAPLSQYIARFLQHGERGRYHEAEARKALQEAEAVLKYLNVPFVSHVSIGEKAECIVRCAEEFSVHEVLLATARARSLTRVVEDAVSSQVLALARVPVSILAGDDVSRFEKFGLPAGIGAFVILMLASSS